MIERMEMYWKICDSTHRTSAYYWFVTSLYKDRGKNKQTSWIQGHDALHYQSGVYMML